MGNTNEIFVRTLEDFGTTFLAELFPIAEQEIDGIAVVNIFKRNKVLTEFGTEVLTVHPDTY